MSYNEQMMKKRISALAKEAREIAGLSRPDLSKSAGVAVKTIYSFENADTWPQATRLAAISNALGWEYEKIERLLNSDRPPAEVTLQDLAGSPWEKNPVRNASDLSDEELLAELTFRFQQRNFELRQLRDTQSNVTPLRPVEFNESMPHAAHPPLKLESSQYDGLGEDPQD
ncbi:helix-turn-helix transcriptional regulator [Glutamicibacter sp. NPDC087344]|uniref:helix-turn-helix transcriptional regulator n=1 Tax=Glutamicibacter sp. NPDC087344 TaxID=3363994 RepID=UPI00382E4F55